MALEWTSSSDWNGAASETKVHHEQPTGTDWAGAGSVEQGYATGGWMPANLEAFYPLDEDSGTTANDVDGDTGDGTVNGATVGASGLNGFTSYDFDGTDDYVDLPGSANWPSSADWTIFVWQYFRTASGTNQDASLGFGDNEGNANENYIGFRSDGIVTQLRDGDSNGSNTETFASEDLNTWYSAAVSLDVSADTVEYYKNGSNYGSYTNTAIGGGDDQQLNSFNDYRLGSGKKTDNVGTKEDFMDGKVQYAMVWSSVLSASEISTLHDAMTSGNLITSEQTP